MLQPMRFIVYGAGAIGGVLGARLHQHGHEVVLIARGAHLEAIRTSGLQIESPRAADVVAVPAVGHPSEIAWRADDVVIVATKTQHTGAALADLAAHAPPECAIVSAQNGVENERLALRRFARVYGIAVMCPAAHFVPGVVQAYSDPVTGILDIGCWPEGVSETARAIAAAFERSTFASQPRPDIARWKYRKLLMNLGNAVQALCAAGGGELVKRAQAEGEACLRATGIGFASEAEDRERRGELLRVQPISGRHRPGGSTWQSLARASGSIETDYLNGEIVLLGRLRGIPTPVNALLQRLANEAARTGRPPGSLSEDALLRLLEQLDNLTNVPARG
jgi:2-dehydropantoate 2-reductase